MKVIVGLGNPGEEYVNSRHNSGFMVVEKLLEKMSNIKLQRSKKCNAEIAQAGDVLLAKPQTYMNRSGEAVVKIMQFYKLTTQDLWVVHDDLDIRLGEYKIQLGRGPKVHNGLASIDQYLGTKDYWRVRIGIENREYKISGEEYVLGGFNKAERETLASVMGKVTDELISKYL